MKLLTLRRSLTLLTLVGGALCFSARSYGDDLNQTLDVLERAGIITHEQAEKARQLAPAPATPAAPAPGASDQQLEELKQKVLILERQREVDKEAKANAPVLPSLKTTSSSWINEMKWYGDLRLRAEDFENPQDWKKSPDAPVQANQPDRLRYRVRLRLGVDLKVQDWANIDARFATGDSVSGSTYSGQSENATFGSSFRKKAAVVDLAYAAIHPPFWDWLTVEAGIIPQPIWHPVTLSPTVYKSEITPQGATELLSYKFGDYQQYKVFGNFGQYVIAEVGGSFTPQAGTSGPIPEGENADSYLFDSEVGLEANLDPVPLRVTLGLDSFVTKNLEHVVPGDSTTSQGNSVNVNANSPYIGDYLSDFDVIQGLGEVAWTISPQPVLKTPNVLTLGGEYLKNLSPTYENAPGGDYTTAWALQAVYGQAKSKGQWSLGYEYKYLGANSTWDAIVDDNFSVGYGSRNAVPGAGTDIKGHVVNLTYSVFDWWQISFNGFIAERISPFNPVARPPLQSHPISPSGDYAVRLQLDNTLKF
ncbi:MAG: putative porin [Verrucomicrobiia bacterium]|jgi:hypothetical protein